MVCKCSCQWRAFWMMMMMMKGASQLHCVQTHCNRNARLFPLIAPLWKGEERVGSLSGGAQHVYLPPLRPPSLSLSSSSLSSLFTFYSDQKTRAEDLVRVQKDEVWEQLALCSDSFLLFLPSHQLFGLSFLSLPWLLSIGWCWVIGLHPCPLANCPIAATSLLRLWKLRSQDAKRGKGRDWVERLSMFPGK